MIKGVYIRFRLWSGNFSRTRMGCLDLYVTNFCSPCKNILAHWGFCFPCCLGLYANSVSFFFFCENLWENVPALHRIKCLVLFIFEQHCTLLQVTVLNSMNLISFSYDRRSIPVIKKGAAIPYCHLVVLFQKSL